MSAMAAPLSGGVGTLFGPLAPSTESSATQTVSHVKPLQPSAKWTEAELIDACLAGSRVAQKELYTRYAGRMLAVCLRYAQTTFEAEDVMQDGFVTVFNNLRLFRRECPLEFWIRRIMINAALRQHRRSAAMLAVTENEYPETIADEEFILSNYSFEELLKMIQELAPRYRMVFNLFAIEGYGHKEIGDMLGISEGTSKSQYSRARAILKTKLERLDYRHNDSLYR